MSIDPQRLVEPDFWHQPLETRMAQMADVREWGCRFVVAIPEVTVFD